jgi:DHA2 family multidrug resistance protein-like MFS transporter
MIDLNLFASPAFSAALTIYTLITFILFGAFIFIFQYLQLVQNLSPLRAWVVVATVLRWIYCGIYFCAHEIAHRFRPVHVVTWGLVLAVIGFGLIDTSKGGFGTWVFDCRYVNLFPGTSTCNYVDD